MGHEEEHHKRPKGILKNSPQSQTALGQSSTPQSLSIIEPLDTKEITLQNTLQNAGRRRSSQSSLTRRPSVSSCLSHHEDEDGPRLKWDEANLYLAEQEKTAKMKIDEPKTPFAPHYDPAEDEEEMRLAEAQEALLNAQGLVVDELDGKSKKEREPRRGISEEDIPEFELGEPEEAIPVDAGGDGGRIVRKRSLSADSQKGKHVVVGAQAAPGVEDVEKDDRLTPEQYKEKHRVFEQRRKKHYEMKNIKDLLAHPEQLDDEDEENGNENENGNGHVHSTHSKVPPPMPQIPERFLNGKK